MYVGALLAVAARHCAVDHQGRAPGQGRDHWHCCRAAVLPASCCWLSRALRSRRYFSRWSSSSPASISSRPVCRRDCRCWPTGRCVVHRSAYSPARSFSVPSSAGCWVAGFSPQGAPLTCFSSAPCLRLSGWRCLDCFAANSGEIGLVFGHSGSTIGDPHRPAGGWA